MSITYPITLPSGGIRAVEFRPYSVVGVSMSPFTLQQQVQAHQGQLWAANVRLKTMARADAEAWIAALLSLNGRYGTFLLGDPSATSPRGIATGTPKIDGASQTGQELSTKGWTGTQTGILVAGDWIQLGSSTTQRIYRVMKTVNSDSGGKATLDIWPRLRESPANDAAITLTSTKGVFRLAENVMAWSVDAIALYGIEFGAAEAI